MESSEFFDGYDRRLSSYPSGPEDGSRGGELAEEGTSLGRRRSCDGTISTTRSKRMRTTEADLKPLGYRDEGGGKEGEVDGGQPSPPPRRLSYEQESERGKVE